MKSISIFNNKGGVGKTTLTFHLAHALAELGHRTLIIDLDPQCNLTILGLDEEEIHGIWAAEDRFIDDFQQSRNSKSQLEFNTLLSTPRSIHFLLKPTEDGQAEIDRLPPPRPLANNLDLIPGRLTMHLFEDKIAGRWSDVYQGDPLAIRTITRIREIAVQYARQHNYEIVIMDTSPSLGALNKVIISTTDGFVIPCAPDMFSLYGIRNIGNALKIWKKQFETIYGLISDDKRRNFPDNFVNLLGFTIYNAKKYSGQSNPWSLAKAHFNYANQIPTAIQQYVPSSIKTITPPADMDRPIGDTAVMHTHNTLPGMAQKYHTPMWKVPDATVEPSDRSTIAGNSNSYFQTKTSYQIFTRDILSRISLLEQL